MARMKPRRNTRRIVILASGSPRRRELLGLTGLMFSLRTGKVDEAPRPGEAAEDFVRRLSQAKARAAASDVRAGALIVAADTAVMSDGHLLGKPTNPAEAEDMLRALRGRTHAVLTSLTLLDTATGQTLDETCRTVVPMRNYTDEEIAGYIATGDPMDKAGAYGIQHAGFRPVENLTGCYANVMGLPLCHLERALRRWEIPLSADVPARCQQFTHYQCPAYAAIQRGEE